MPIEGIKIEGDTIDPAYAETIQAEEAAQVTTPVETPVVPVETPATPVETTPTETPSVIPFEQKWKEVFGEVDVDSVKNKYSQFDTINTEYEQLKTRPTYKTDAGKQIDEWLSKGVKLETISRFQNLKATELTPEQAIKLRLEIENPKLESRHINADYTSKYIHVKDELKSDESNAIDADLKEAALIKDGESAKQFLADYLDKQFNPSGELDVAKRKEAQTQLASSWTNTGAALSSAVKDIKDELVFKVPGEKGEEEVKLNYSYSVPENDLKTLTARAIDAAVQNGIQPTAENLPQVQQYLDGLVWANFGRKIVHAAINDALSKQTESFAKIIHNPVVNGGGNVKPSGLDFGAAILEHELKNRNGNR